MFILKKFYKQVPNKNVQHVKTLHELKGLNWYKLCISISNTYFYRKGFAFVESQSCKNKGNSFLDRKTHYY